MKFVDNKLIAVKELVLKGEEEAFIVVDLEDIREKFRAWKTYFPRVEPFYAVKCNQDSKIVKLLADLGSNFDCASRAEIDQVISCGVHPDRIIYANPCKQYTHLRHATEKGVTFFTFDNADELRKIKKTCPHAKLLLRIRPDDTHSVCRLGLKFGADIEVVPSLLRLAKSLELNVCGASYHVGSGCFNGAAFIDAIYLAHRAFEYAREEGLEWNILDIGGGFPGDSVASWNQPENSGKLLFPVIAAQMNQVLDQLFPKESGIRLIAEPGRYFVHSCGTLAANIIGRRETSEVQTIIKEDSYSSDSSEDERKTFTDYSLMYYVNEGVYGSFNNLIYDHAHVTPCVLELDDNVASDLSVVYKSSVWGHTCDSIDCISRDVELPKLEIGRWLYFENMGAYTIAAASKFNGFERAKVIYLNE